MAQGSLNLAKKKPARVTKHQKNPKPAAPKIHKPTKANSNEKQLYKLSKLHAAKLTASTERLIAGRVGHLEVIKGSRRQLDKAEKAKKAKQQS
ncbi:hypothetical protein CANARDRAFT_194680 [[Candida] arabinofermentans NRRL YB-2248]|uniref:Uncharacterized protein n=1 Tax=[Candida] arabinofermentans NRRL YB-2248 TaxID=983967 RepID=A0A1E4T698_9ASCO|nr:hypothetical protein CANARDRAFT_194680 [[Candida] arabinofermentans NRRL YB-2248]